MFFYIVGFIKGFMLKLLSNNYKKVISLVIVFVVDNFKNKSNGTTITAQRFREMLEKDGHEVRVVTNDHEGENIYQLKTNFIPIVSYVSKKQGYTFSKPNRKVLREAFTGADIIHFFTPWKTTRVGLKIAKKMNIPTTIAFHVPPESIIYGGNLNFISKPLEYYIYRKFKKTYKKVRNVHCPSKNIAEKLKKRRYPNQLHIISNGIGEEFIYKEKTTKSDKFKILTVGRLAPEKDQKTIIKAISLSKYKDNIELTLAGIGPNKERLQKLVEQLGVNANFGFYSKEQLIDVIHNNDLYIHSSLVEIEGLSCLEAISCGRVPVIANTKKSAAAQFALDNRSLFKGEDSEDLKNKIEYWIENEDERKKMELKYSESTSKYKLSYSIERFTDFLKEAINDHKNDNLVESKVAKKYIKRINKGRISRTFSSLFYYLVVPILMLFNKAYLRVRFVNKKNIKKVKGGAVIISNHVHSLDSVLSGLVAFPKKVIFTSMRTNFDLPVAGLLVRALGAVPTPEGLTENRVFFNELSKKTRSGRFVHFFPEGELIQGDTELREFKRGAFKMAVDSSVPILPIRITFKDHKKKKDKKRMVVNVGKPIMPDFTLNTKMAINKLRDQTIESMQQLGYKMN